MAHRDDADNLLAAQCFFRLVQLCLIDGQRNHTLAGDRLSFSDRRVGAKRCKTDLSQHIQLQEPVGVDLEQPVACRTERNFAFLDLPEGQILSHRNILEENGRIIFMDKAFAVVPHKNVVLAERLENRDILLGNYMALCKFSSLELTRYDLRDIVAENHTDSFFNRYCLHAFPSFIR